MTWVVVYILTAYLYMLAVSIGGVFSRGWFRANCIQQVALFLLAVWSAWRIQLIVEYGYVWTHEALVITATSLFATGTIMKARQHRKGVKK